LNASDSVSSDSSATSGGSTTSGGSGAYLVLRSAGRWSDVFRLSPPGEAVIGRASTNQIAIRTDQASRRHARIHWGGQQWFLEDLESRNGTFLNGNRIASPQPLEDGDVIEVGGYAITFTGKIEGGLGEPVISPHSSQATDDQLTMEVDAAAITDRRRRSRYLHEPFSGGSGGSVASQSLLQLAFALARCEKTATAVESVLDLIGQQVTFDTAGIYVWDGAKSPAKTTDLPLVATRQSGARSYRRPPETLIDSVAAADGAAILARNVVGDEHIATENSRGEIDVESMIIAPVRDREGVLRGMIHLTTTSGSPPLGGDQLELVVAVAEILAESLSNLWDRKRLSRSLHRSRKQVAQLQEQLGDKVQIIGSSPAIGDVIQQITLAAPTQATVLIRGESGVGKELVAAALHHASGRRDGPLICLNCAALSPSLLESELFGHEKGAFTGATDRKRGKFEAADGGTLMLDEIGEMSAEIQAKFLRVLEGHPFERVGGHTPIRVDVRVVAATNRDLQAMVRQGEFRQDLYYRLHVVEIVVPPLRARGKDCLQLAQFFLERFNAEMGRKIDGFSPAAKKRLLDYSWPGNIRELKNVIERAVVLNTKSEIDDSDLALAPAVEGGSPLEGEGSGHAEMTLAELERQHIERVLRHTGGNKSRAATILGIERSTLDRKLKKFAAD
jgi:Nif-specific regulatory protein